MGDVTYLDPGQQQLTATEKNLTDVIHCLTISLSNEALLLPNAAVAEVIGYVEPEPLDGAPDWFLGRIAWRERLVPLIALEHATASQDEVGKGPKGNRIAILNTLNGNQELPYIAIISQGIPSLNVVRNEDIASVEVLPATRSSIAEIVELNGEQRIILDIDDLENRILNIHT